MRLSRSPAMFPRFILAYMALAALAFAKTPADALSVVAYNIKHGRGMDGKIDLDRTAAVLSALEPKPDLIALQEVDKNCKRSGNVDQAAELGRKLGMHHRFGKFMDFQSGEYGMAVLSRHPIQRTLVHHLPGGKEPRCALEVWVAIPDEETSISFVSIHNDPADESIRMRQVRTLLEKLTNRPHPVILAGDFNGERDDASLQFLEQRGWNIHRKTGGVTGTVSAPEPEREIDFVVSKGLARALIAHPVVDEKLASDHRPIHAIFTGKP